MSAAVESSRVLKLVALHTRLVSAMMPPPMIYLPDTVVCGMTVVLDGRRLEQRNGIALIVL
jgi:hypothetical protein